MQNKEILNNDIMSDDKYNNTNLNGDNVSNDEWSDESDTDTYINLKDILEVQQKNIYQTQINNEKVVIKHIGYGSHIPDIIIKEEFGKNKNLYLYSCVYTNDEIDFLKTKIDNDKFLPVVKLIEKMEPEDKVYSMSIKINCLFDYNEPFVDFDTYLTYSTNSTYVYHIKLDKNINPSNIIEKMLEKIIELGFNIL